MLKAHGKVFDATHFGNAPKGANPTNNVILEDKVEARVPIELSTSEMKKEVEPDTTAEPATKPTEGS